ncbi:methylthioribulose 1-phosphate dehydratase [Acidocella sp.]|uniref:methylthioribulose 1-phosphate dehydratase n=1 Tax=Acidocella sp. TaxID=50710 RepID=UPI003D052D79
MVPATVASALAEVGRRMDSRGWVPGSSGNLSAKLDDNQLAITRSGVHKGRLVAETDIIAVDYEGKALMSDQKPSAETLLHCQLYRLFPAIGAVLHGHSVAATILSLSGPIVFSNYELLKAFGFTTHELDITLPVYENDQDIGRLASVIEPNLQNEPPIGYVIAGHGVYAWGTNVEHAYWRLEALEFLLACELERRQMK